MKFRNSIYYKMFFLGIFLGILGCGGENAPPITAITDWQRDLLRGEVRTVALEVYTNTTQQQGRNYIKRSKTTYNTQGHTMELLELQHPTGPNQPTTQIYKATYTPRGKQQDSVWVTNEIFVQDSLISKDFIVYIQDQFGHYTQMLYAPSKVIPTKENSIYKINIKNDLSGRWIAKYHIPAQMRSHTEFPCKETRSYNEKGQLEEEVLYLFHPSKNRSCSENGILTKYSNYNPNGDFMKEEIFDIEGTLRNSITHQYKYDAKGNWTQRNILNKHGQLISIHIREIEYFN